MKKSVRLTDTYFAAANGYDGFWSNFDKVFAPLELSKLYILKGGPGTGKSTLMKRIAEKFSGVASVTKILCSSDISSLDGVLIEKGGHTVGIADGTAPHVIEPRYPGVVERIINLADGFDYKALAGHRDTVLSLSEGKGKGYKRGYHALKSAGSIHKYICDVFLDNGIYKKAEMLAEDLLKDIPTGESASTSSAFFLSSFSKDGYKTLPISDSEKRIVRIGTDGICGYTMMSVIYKNLAKRKVAARLYSSPLSSDLLDIIETDEYVFLVGEMDDAHTYDIRLIVDTDEYSRLKEAYDEMMSEAKIGFAEASRFHFALEDVYRENISFNSNDKMREEIISDIVEVFDK